MATVNSAAQDAALNYIKNNAGHVYVCSAAPTTYTEASSTFALGGATVTATDYTLGTGSPSGRKVTQAALTVTGTAAGTATYYAIVDTVNSALLFTNTMTNVAITNGGPQDLNAVDVWTVEDPA